MVAIHEVGSKDNPAAIQCLGMIGLLYIRIQTCQADPTVAACPSSSKVVVNWPGEFLSDANIALAMDLSGHQTIKAERRQRVHDRFGKALLWIGRLLQSSIVADFPKPPETEADISPTCQQ